MPRPRVSKFAYFKGRGPVIFRQRSIFFVSMFRLLSIGRKVVAQEMDLADTNACVFYGFTYFQFSSVVAQSCLTVQPHGQQHARPPCPLPTSRGSQTHVHWVGYAIQPSHPLSSPSPPAYNLSQHQGLFKLVSSSHHVAKVLEFQLQHQSFQWIFRTDLL